MAVAVTAGKPQTRTPRTAERTMPESQRMAIRIGHIRKRIENCCLEAAAAAQESRERIKKNAEARGLLTTWEFQQFLLDKLDLIEEELVAANRYSSQLAPYATCDK